MQTILALNVTGYDAIVVGGGVVGCAAAHDLAADHEVLVLEKDTIASGATGKASGLISPVYDHQANLEAAAYATEFFEVFEGRNHVSPTMPGGVFLFGADEHEHAQRSAKRARNAGFGAAMLSPADLADRYPGTFDTDQFAGAVVFDKVGWLDSHTFATALRKRAEERGATVETGLTVEGLLANERETVTGVRTAEGLFEAPTVVVAAGWRTRELVAAHLDVPVRPFRYQTAEIEIDGELEDSFPVAWEHETLLYWRPTQDGSLHVGGQPYFVGEPGTTVQGATADFKGSIARAIPSYLPSIDDPASGAMTRAPPATRPRRTTSRFSMRRRRPRTAWSSRPACTGWASCSRRSPVPRCGRSSPARSPHFLSSHIGWLALTTGGRSSIRRISRRPHEPVPCRKQPY